jgi:predicted nuclease of restriction endonuclease-like RecB superfamily
MALAGTLARPHELWPELVPGYLTERDHPWLLALIEVYDRFVGRPRQELDARLREPLAAPCSPRSWAVAVRVLDRMYRSRIASALPPPAARAALFGAAAERIQTAVAVLHRVAQELRVSPRELGTALFADVPAMRLLTGPEDPPSATEVALLANEEIVRRLVFRAAGVRIRVDGAAHAVVRQAKLGGLITCVRPGPRPGAVQLDVSGPFSLFRRTLVYGRALAQLVPILASAGRFEVRCACELSGRQREVVIRSGDPLRPAVLRRYDSKLEERFARDFLRAAPDYDLIRDPEPVPVAGTLIFPDFAVQRRDDPRRRWLLEIVGFWTAEYLSAKLARLRAARIPNLILCLDVDRDCGRGELPPDAAVIRFRKRIDPVDVLRTLNGSPGAGRARCT